MKNEVAKPKKEILIIGTFHFANPKLDIAKKNSFAILDYKTQNELTEIAQKIKEFNPTKIFVEWPYKQQTELDSVYHLYKKGLLPPDIKDEIHQLAFRTGKLLQLNKIDAIDYNDTDFPFDKVMISLKKNNQKELENHIMGFIKQIETDFNSKLKESISLKEMIYYHNTKEFRKTGNQVYDKILETGNHTDFIGAYLTSEWNRRNLYMWSLIKKKTTNKDERVMLLLGASHIANIKNLIDDTADWKSVELIDVVNTKK